MDIVTKAVRCLFRRCSSLIGGLPAFLQLSLDIPTNPDKVDEHCLGPHQRLAVLGRCGSGNADGPDVSLSSEGRLQAASQYLHSTGPAPLAGPVAFGLRTISGRRAPLIARRSPQPASLLQSPKGAIGTPWVRSRMPSSYTPPWSLRSVFEGMPDPGETVSSTAATEQLATSCSLAGAWPLGSL
jgi:hypothetical protein